MQGIRTIASGELSTSTSGTIRFSLPGVLLPEIRLMFDVPGLEPGHYQLKVSKSNFETYEQVVEVTVGSKTVIDVKLTVGSSSTIVEVIAAGSVQVNTETHELSQLVDSQQLQNLPSLTRNPYDFIVTSGNVSSGDNTTSSMDSGQNLTNRGVGYSINGQRESGTEILLDGAENVAVFGVNVGQDIPVDAVQEYSVVTNNFSAEYGRASGGVVNLSLKSGTNQLHGSAWEVSA
jgi:TonB-dependent Receptor Plug Domain/PEGA domain